ncbi:MAG TPA: glycosyltransferase [Cytophagaceae bacterium]|jgi:glycosyltransferase involved in cell wall biosynthesis
MEGGRKPKVSIICLCYNHSEYVEEAIMSILNQTYKNIEIIVVDDCSIDNSRDVISRLLLSFPQINFIANQSNIGNCKSFNKAFAVSTGDYVIDHSADDVLVDQRVSLQVDLFENLDSTYGLVYSSAEYIDEHGKHLAFHFHNDSPSWKRPYIGEVYEKVVANYFIPSPTVIFKREVLLKMGGYDETLAYEDFDVIARITKEYKVAYAGFFSTKIRKLRSSMSSTQYSYKSLQLITTLKVCRKILWMNASIHHSLALQKRILFESRKAFFSFNLQVFLEFIKLLIRLRSSLRR